MGGLTLFGSGIGAFIMGMAVLSPCPLLVNETSGGVVIVSKHRQDEFIQIPYIVSIVP